MTKKHDDVVPFGDTALADMSFSEMLDAGVIEISEIDDRRKVDQEELVGVPFVLYSWEIKTSDTYGGVYAFCEVKTQDGTAVFADGGAGIAEALERYKGKLVKDGHNPFSPIYFPKGLRKSSYVKKMEDGSSIPATTYYFDN